MSYKDAVPVQQKDGSWVLSYQITNDKGEKVGPPTVLTGASEKECYRKAMIAHQEAAQAIERLRNSQIIIKPGQYTDSEKEAIKHNIAALNFTRDNESVKFMRRHLTDFNSCDANANILRDIMEREGFSWNQEFLEQAFAIALREDKLAPVAAYGADSIPVPEVVEPEKPLDVPWSPNPLTKKGVHDLGRTYTDFYLHKNPAIRAEFRRQVDAAIKGE